MNTITLNDFGFTDWRNEEVKPQHQTLAYYLEVVIEFLKKTSLRKTNP